MENIIFSKILSKTVTKPREIAVTYGRGNLIYGKYYEIKECKLK